MNFSFFFYGGSGVSVRINGIKKLDANAYNEMIIRELDNKYFVRVIGDRISDEYISISYKLSDNFKGISDSEKIILLVDSCLENMQVTSIEPIVLYTGYEGNFIKVNGTRKLYLQINNSELIKIIIKMIINKYNRDRYRYLMDTNINNLYGIYLERYSSSYNSKFVPCENCEGCEPDKDCPKYIKFKLMYMDGRIASFDKMFIEKFIYDKLWEKGEYASISEVIRDIKLIDGTKVSECVDSYNIICGDLIIKFDCSLFNRVYILDFCNSIVDRYNKDLSECENVVKKKQLKMEGF